MKLNVIVAACLASGLACGAFVAPSAAAEAAAALPGPAFPDFASAAAVDQACASGLAGASARIKALETTRPGIGWLRAWDGLAAWTEDQSGALTFLQYVHPDAAIRAASAACELRWQDLQSTLGLNEKAYQGGARTHLKDAIDRQTLRVALEGFEDAGVSLPRAKRARAKAISDRLVALSQDFDKAIRDANVRVAFTAAELKGVPEDVWKEAPKDADGRIVLGVANPVYLPVLQGAEDAAARERMWRAKFNVGGEANLKRLSEIMQLRREYARLFGFPSYADFLLRRRMAENTARAQKFLGEVQAAVADRERQDLADLRDAKARHLGLAPEKVKVERWDPYFYLERLKREKFNLDDESFRPYFPPQQSLQFVMRLAEKMFGITYTRVPGSYWQPDVQAYAVTDKATGKPLASLYVDLYPRDGKYNHAAVWPIRNASTATGRTPQAALVVNFDRKGLTLEELETLLHEFGHSLHGNLSATRWVTVGGTTVMRDFVEAPSQMLEDWVYDPKVMKVFQEVCPECKPVPDELLARAQAARDYGKGYQTARQLLYATYDLALHTADAPDPMATWAKMEGATPLGYAAGSMFPAGFSHIAGSYGAGYYGYLWSKVVALDMRTAFAADKLDPAVGARYRARVIGQGGQKLPQQLVKDFLGRDMSTAAFFDDLRK